MIRNFLCYDVSSERINLQDFFSVGRIPLSDTTRRLWLLILSNITIFLVCVWLGLVHRLFKYVQYTYIHICVCMWVFLCNVLICVNSCSHMFQLNETKIQLKHPHFSLSIYFPRRHTVNTYNFRQTRLSSILQMLNRKNIYMCVTNIYIWFSLCVYLSNYFHGKKVYHTVLNLVSLG